MIRPPRLRAGDRVALIAPAGPVSADRIETALNRCRAFGFEPILGRAAHARRAYLAGSDEERLADFEWALHDDDVAAIWPLRGGYGTMRLLLRLDFDALRDRPKAYIGFSDHTAVHLALARRSVISFHGPHSGAEHFPPVTDACFRRVLLDAEPPGLLPAGSTVVKTLRSGSATGRLLGGNLALLAACCGTGAAPDLRGCLLVLEDIAEPAYRVDRMLTQLELAGATEGVAGVVAGAFSDVPDGEEEVVAELLAQFCDRAGVPGALGFPIGHQSENWTLPMGVQSRLDAVRGTLEVLEPAVL